MTQLTLIVGIKVLGRPPRNHGESKETTLKAGIYKCPKYEGHD